MKANEEHSVLPGDLIIIQPFATPHLTIICGDLSAIDARVSHLLDVSLADRQDVTLALHPAAQRRASEQVHFFNHILSGAQRDVTATHLIVVTNSEPIISKVGEMIELGELDHNAVTIETADSNGLRVCSFDSKGILQEWQIGYLS